MNYKLIDSVPDGDVEEINIDQQFVNKTDDYEQRFSLFIDRVLSLIEQRKPIEYTNAGIGCCDKALAIDPRDEQAWFCKGSWLGPLGRHEDAIKADRFRQECYCYDFEPINLNGRQKAERPRMATMTQVFGKGIVRLI